MNWRSRILPFLFRLKGSSLYQYFREYCAEEWIPYDRYKALQEERLNTIHQYAIKNCEYYSVLASDTKFKVSGFPILTKDILRENQKDLLSSNHHKYKVYKNSSGGSTGNPTTFYQDRFMWDRNMGMKLYYLHMNGKELGERELKLWGSERDIFKGSIGLKSKLENSLYNRKLLNSFRMSKELISDYIGIINSWKPKILWTYVDSVHELARYITLTNEVVYSPPVIMTTAGTLYDHVRKEIQAAFPDSHIVNQYGSREVGDIACECREHDGLHVLGQNLYVEILNRYGVPCKYGEIGEIVVTLLTNFSMPLIRYKIGDTGAWKKDLCKCGRQTDMIENIAGRVTDHFVTSKNDIIHGEYFTHLFYHMDWLQSFQVIQNDVDEITVKYVPRSTQIVEEDIEEIEKKIKLVMGNMCTVSFDRYDEIPRSASGKYLYTKSLVKR